MMEQTREQRLAAEALVAAVEAQRTLRDKEYASAIDALIPRASAAATRIVGPRAARRDVGRRAQWDQMWSREFHKGIDAIAHARGLRQQSHQEE